jgi:type I restriction enzyme R subunit
MPSPEDKARENIDGLLTQAGWAVRDQSDANILAYRGVAIRNFTLKPGHGFADYLLYVDGRAAGVIEAKKEGVTLTGVETRFTNRLDPEPRSRPVFSFHKLETFAEWLEIGPQLQAADRATDYGKRTGTFLSRIQHIPPLIDDLWPPKPRAIMKIEQSLRENRPRSLVQMVPGYLDHKTCVTPQRN